MALDPNEITAVNKMLHVFGREGMTFYKSSSYTPWQEIVRHHRVVGNERELEGLLPSARNMSGTLNGFAIPLVPSKKGNGAAALLRAEWDFEANPWVLKYYLLLYYGTVAGGKPDLGLSFRLEQPERGGKPGNHDYWHIQMCRTVASDKKTAVLACHNLVPDSYPAFPLNANDAVTLTASIPLALSGRPALRETIAVLTGQGQLQKRLSDKYSNAIA